MRNNKSIYITIIIIGILVLVGYLIVRNNSSEDDHDHEMVENKVDEISTVTYKEVALNEAQFNAAKILLGTFSSKNLSDVIHANGYTKLPPQNQADVSVFANAIVKQISIIEGQKVQKGQTVAILESPEFAKLQEAYLTSRSNLEFLKLEFKRQESLNDEEINSRKIFQKSKAEYDIEVSRNQSLLRQLQLLNINPNASISSTVAVKAPISGYITEIFIKIGSTVEPGKSLMNIVDNSQLHLDLLVYEKDLNKVKPGQTVRFMLTNQGNEEIKGKIFNVGKAFESDTKSVAVHADISNEGQKLIPGMYVNALIDIEANKTDALPLEAVVKAEGREFIFILEEIVPERKAEDGNAIKEKEFHFLRIEVKSGTSQLGFVHVDLLQSIPKDAQIVLSGAYYLQSHLIKNDGGGGHAH
ncbi:efflux RND transporter periplasmic adaptor subunit [Flavobacterium ardleyense]|uniref:efflux RND transporter periplasmic adaptor subunit n=1 Tax=Flavobacterium ardleyense TaxID=2038737 RepID=UPI00298CC888|nr:efflux RND transporter periplasmic adaptor subunit [Flavobacterium ardleyense]